MKARSHVSTDYLRQALESRGYIGETVTKSLAFFLKEILKVSDFRVAILPGSPEGMGSITISVFDKSGKEVFLSPKPEIMATLRGYINIPNYEIRFAENER